ncbi:hypothetical protein N0M98_02220 [Paenibacillus doosanensis]|uniref:hypothetical protein n=1 Tax=Paenibacillus doosanensis TaxID=1229154 RepID=UPI00217F4218|nr:hypothetical protein [Paenibacillus doosanensis]MCS7458945.1 hypothetical protein [Paenibacillus doosanensis]
MSDMLRMALPKDSCDAAAGLLRKAGIELPEELSASRKYLFQAEGLEWILVKPADVPLLVETGAADLGITGKHLIAEAAKKSVELLDLGTNRLALSLFGPENALHRPDLVVATKFPRIASSYFLSRGFAVRTTPVMEELQAFSDVTLDAEPGYRLRGNRPPIGTVMQASDRLIAGRGSFVWKRQAVEALYARLEKVL